MQEGGSAKERPTDQRKPARVPARASQWWRQPSAIGLADTEGQTYGLGDEAKSRSLSIEHPPTGEPDAGEPHVRFGGRGGATMLCPYPYVRCEASQPSGVGDPGQSEPDHRLRT